MTTLTSIVRASGFATTAQGALADTAVQPNDNPTFGNITATGTVDGVDIAQSIPASLGTVAQVLTVNAGATAGEWADAGGGDFVSITEGGNTGYGTSYRAANPANYGDIGNNAVDLSYSNVASTTRGATGKYSTATGYRTTAIADYSTAMGNLTIASGTYSTAMGHSTTASGSSSTAMGKGTTASGAYSTAMGGFSTASDDYSTAMGDGTTASASSSTAMGSGTTASGWFSTAMGSFSTASASSSTAMGYGTKASASSSTAMGNGTTASGIYSTAMGYQGGTGSAGTTLLGVAYSATPATVTTADLNLVFKVNQAGNGYFDGAADIGAADYAEYFESFDGTPLERGHFVSFVEGSNCLEYGNADIVGIVSSSPAVVGDSQSLHYKGKYKKDEFDTYIRETVVVTEELHALFTHQQGEAWEVVNSGSLPGSVETFLIEIKNKETQEVLETITEEAALAGDRLYDFEVEVVGTYTHTMIDKVLSDTYDEALDYVPRSDRPEWSPVGLLGKLWVHLAADEIVKVGDYITSDTGGKAVLCARSDASAFRVLDVNNEFNLVKVFYK